MFNKSESILSFLQTVFLAFRDNFTLSACSLKIFVVVLLPTHLINIPSSMSQKENLKMIVLILSVNYNLCYLFFIDTVAFF